MKSTYLFFCLLFRCLSLLGDQSVDLNQYSTGARSVSDGIDATEKWVNDDFTITWEILELDGGYHYTYEISGDNTSRLSRKIAELIFEVGANVSPSNFDQAIQNFSVTGANVTQVVMPQLHQVETGSGIENIYGFLVNFHTSAQSFPLTIEFDSIAAPVWGDFFAEGHPGSKDIYAYNIGLGTDPDIYTQDFNNWIPVPDTVNVPIPEPGTYLMLAAMLCAVAFVSRKKGGSIQ